MQPAGVAGGEQKRSEADASAVRMSSIERSAHRQLTVRAFEPQPQHAWNAGHSAVGHSDDQLGSAMSFALPHPRGTDAVSESAAQAIETARIGLVVARE